MKKTVEMVGGPRDGETFELKKLDPQFELPMPPQRTLQGNPVKSFLVPLTMLIYRRRQETLLYDFVGVEG